ncbi:dihydroflavonol 4-reductase-like [Coffea arabica]|uniref:Dihydroflavonol 4-reductase-like n=1 Tax=Coffea arabica TaxID=13443 RepID=A0A6P6W2G0_COFAR|nr:dihydroflavonol 4-reductase-like [Coffea arabica]
MLLIFHFMKSFYFSELRQAYARSKTLAEKEVLRYNDEKKLEVVSLVCGLVGGYKFQSLIGESMRVLVSHVTKAKMRYQRFLVGVIGKLPVLHVEDVIDAHIFCVENPGFTGRFLCASDLLKSEEIATLIQSCCSESKIPDEFIEDSNRDIRWGSSKLEELGFHYKYDAVMTLNDSPQYFRVPLESS